MTLNITQWIHYLDDDMVVVNKPGGLPSVPGNNPYFPHNLYHLLLDELPPIYVVHRLDILTSGLILFARNKVAQRQLNIAFQDRKIDKRYHALLAGRLESQAGEINLPIISDWYQKPYQKLCFSSGKPATTRYQRLAVFERTSSEGSAFDNSTSDDSTFDNSKSEYTPSKFSTLVEFNPVTGRSHQLRVHANLLGHPIIGCELYGQRSLWQSSIQQPKAKTFGANDLDSRLMLHASRLSLYHPITQKPISFKSAANFPTD